MKLECVVENIKNAVNIVEHATGKNSSIPVINSFLVKSEKKHITIFATNLELGIYTHINGVVQDDGAIVVPAKIFNLFISSLPSKEKIIIQSKGSDILLTTEKQKTNMKGFSVEDFPPFPSIKEKYLIQFPKSVIYNILKRSVVSAARFNIKQELNNILFLVRSASITIASTDSFRLSESKINQKNFHTSFQGSDPQSFLLPIKTTEELVRLLEIGEDEAVVFRVSDRSVEVSTKTFTLFSRLTEGKFPEYQEVVPKKFKTTIIINQPNIIDHIKRAGIFSEKLNSLTLHIKPNKPILFTTRNESVGEHESYVDAKTAGDEVTITVNWRYLLDGVFSIGGGELFMGINNSLDPILLRQNANSDAIHIVMPMKGV